MLDYRQPNENNPKITRLQRTEKIVPAFRDTAGIVHICMPTPGANSRTKGSNRRKGNDIANSPPAGTTPIPGGTGANHFYLSWFAIRGRANRRKFGGRAIGRTARRSAFEPIPPLTGTARYA